MDINQLFSQHQRALFAAQNAPPGPARQSSIAMVEHYARRVGEFRKEMNLPRYRWE